MTIHAHEHDSPSPLDREDDQGGWTPRLVFSLIGMALVLELLTISYLMVATALPKIAAHYHTTQVAWMMSSFLLVGAVTSPILGKLADLYGKRKMLMVAVVGAGAGSVISAVAPNFGLLVVGRSLQGLLVPCMFLSYSLMRDVYPARILPLAVSIATGGMGLIAIPAPWLSGWLLDTWGFRAVFWFFVIALALLAVVIRVTTDESAIRQRARVDYLGALLLGAGLAAVLAGVSMEIQWGGWSSGRTLGFLISGTAVLLVWLAVALRTREPLVDLRFFRRRSVSMTALSAGLGVANTGVFATLMPMLCMTPAVLGLHYGFGVDAEGYAIFAAPLGAGAVIGGLIVGVLVSRISPRYLLIAGSGLLAAAAVLVAVSHGSRGMVITWCAVQGLGQGLCYAAGPNLVIRAVPPALQGSMSSMLQVFSSGLGAIFPVVVFTVLNSGHVTVVQGNIFYSNSGMTTGFLITAGIAVAAAITAFAIPHRVHHSATVSEPVSRGQEVSSALA